MWSAPTNGQDTVMLINPGRFREPLSLARVIEDVVAPKSCAFWSDPAGPPPARVFTAAAVVSQAVASAMTGSPPAGAYRTFRATVTPREQAALLARTGQALQTCRADVIDARSDGDQWR